MRKRKTIIPDARELRKAILNPVLVLATQKRLPQMAAARLLSDSHANPAASRFSCQRFNSESGRRAPARHTAANACDCYGRRRWLAFVSIDERSRQTCRSARRQISDRRYSDQQLPQLRAAL